jgi:hypothetical protein
MNPVKAFTLIALGLAIAAMGIYVADADDAPGAAVIGMLLMVVGVVLGVRAARNRLPMWAARTALAVGVAGAAFAAFLTHGVVVTAPLFAFVNSRSQLPTRSAAFVPFANTFVHRVAGAGHGGRHPTQWRQQFVALCYVAFLTSLLGRFVRMALVIR